MDNEIKNLVYGKQDLERIVSVEPLDEQTLLFIENQDGTITKQFVKNSYWILSNEKLDEKSIRLKGDLHYKWGKKFNERLDFIKARRFFKEKDIYSIYDAKESFLVKEGYTYYKGMDYKEVSILSFDIETTSLEYTSKDKVLLISNTFRKNGVIERKLFAYDDYANQGEMIKAWCKWVREKDPSIIIGHNIYSFDLPYLNLCAQEHLTSLELGRDGSDIVFEQYESKFRKDQTQFLNYHKVRCFGREICDTLFVAIRYDVVKKKYDSYGLKPIISKEGLEDPNRVFYDASTIRHNYKDKTEWEKIKQYCEHDADDALKLYDLMIAPTFYFAQNVPKAFQSIVESATGSQVNSMLVRAYLQQGHSIPKTSEGREFTGAISWGNPGIWSNCIKWDISSLYPSVMLQYEIYPKFKDPQKVFLKILKYFTDQRLLDKQEYNKTKNKYYEDVSNSRKIFINSSYGLLGAPGLCFNDSNSASEVTRKGREILETSIKWATGKSYKEWNVE